MLPHTTATAEHNRAADEENQGAESDHELEPGLGLEAEKLL